MIFTKSDFRIIQVTDFDRISMSYPIRISDVRPGGKKVLLNHPKILLGKVTYIRVILRPGVF